MTQSTILRHLALFALVGAFAAPALSQQLPALRIGYTDHEIIISNMPEYLDIQRTLQDEYEASQRSLQVLADEFQRKVERYQTQQALLSEERRAEREQDLADSQQEIQEKATEAERDLAQLEADLLSPIFARVDDAIQRISEEKGLDLVLRIQAGRAQPIILYANEDRITDITLDVARDLGIDVSEAESTNN